MTERVLSRLVELDLDKCQNTFGVSPCTAGRVESGTAQAGAAGTITLRAGASAVDNAYQNMTVRLTGGTGAGQEGKVASYVGATKVATMTANWSTPPDNTSVYDVIDRPNACYNTFRSCLAKPTYVKGTSTRRFTEVGAPLDKTSPARPYISRVQRAVTELDPEEGLAIRSACSITVVDEECADVDEDPYILDRATPATGTFWTRLLARTLNYTGRWARLKQGYVNLGVFGAYSTEYFVIDSIAGPNTAGELILTLKDPTKLADRSTTPTPTSGKLALALGISDMQATLNPGDGAQYGATGYVRIGDEVIRYDGNTADVLYWSRSSYRAQFGTTAATGAVGDGVQLCQVWIDTAWSTVIEQVLNNAGVLDANIDIAGMQLEESTWLGSSYRVTMCLSDPKDNSDILQQMLQPAQAMLWWDAETQKVKVKVYAPQSPSVVATKTLDESGYLIDRSVTTQRLDTLRITLAAVYFGLRTAVLNTEESKNYGFGEVTVDADAESANEYNERRVQTFYVPWFGSTNLLAMRTHSRRFVARHRDAPEDISFDLDPKDNDVVLGQVLDIQAKNLVTKTGATRTARVLLTRKEHQGTSIKAKARVTTFDRRYGFIAPGGTPDFPNNNGYACVSTAAGLQGDGSTGYLII